MAELEKYEAVWKTAGHGTVSVDAGALARHLKRNGETFRILVYLRDFRELLACFILIPGIIFMGMHLELPWSWYLGVPASLWVAGYILYNRPQRGSETLAGSVVECLDTSIQEVRHQIRLLRSVFWWYLLPLDLSCGAFFLHIGWETRQLGWAAVLFTALLMGLLLGVTWVVWKWNQFAVERELEPRLAELESIRNSIINGDDPVSSAPEKAH
ncbi:MAG: hypothetical protein JJU11_15755 [Candidatus Sumerlaeia bacterium]|nr:hypothetical protein [Candidatus Sumerlaeia bacterium]